MKKIEHSAGDLQDTHYYTYRYVCGGSHGRGGGGEGMGEKDHFKK